MKVAFDGHIDRQASLMRKIILIIVWSGIRHPFNQVKRHGLQMDLTTRFIAPHLRVEARMLE